MNYSDKEEIRSRYRSRLNKYGAGIEALASGTEERRTIRFDVLTKVGIVDGSSVLDVGCGFADYFDYANELGINIQYTGIDIVPELIQSAKNSKPEIDLEVRDLQESPYPPGSFDYVISSQVFNYRFSKQKNEQLVKEMLKLMYETARHGVAVDFLTSYVDFQQDELFYYEPEELFRYSKSLTKRVSLKHDHPLFEFCLYLYKDFKGWA